MVIFVNFSFFFLISVILVIIFFCMNTGKDNRLKSSAFECGYSELSFFSNLISLRFFLISVIFVIFDLEVVLLLPFMWLFSSGIFLKMVILLFLLFLILMFLGTFYEWNEGSFNWSY